MRSNNIRMVGYIRAINSERAFNAQRDADFWGRYWSNKSNCLIVFISGEITDTT